MTLHTFHYFLQLPYELRRDIYFLAILPRIVHVRVVYKKYKCKYSLGQNDEADIEVVEEEEDDGDGVVSESDQYDDYQSFKKEFQKMPPNEMKIHPDIAHFSFNLQPNIEIRQPTLESFGFTGAHGQTSWKLSPATPEIPLNWLIDNSRAAWILGREAYLFSKAPIPPLLHACRQMRAELMDQGYELAFGTRSSEANIWFNFARDTLSLDHADQDDWICGRYFAGWLLSGGPWDIGQFNPIDLRHVRKVVLDRATGYLRPWEEFQTSAGTPPISPIPRLFPNLEELRLVDGWSAPEILPSEDCLGPGEQGWTQKAMEKSSRSWGWISLTELQSRFNRPPPEERWRYQPPSIFCNWINWGDTHSTSEIESNCEQKLTDERAAMIGEYSDMSTAEAWSIPRVSIGVILQRSVIELASWTQLMEILVPQTTHGSQ